MIRRVPFKRDNNGDDNISSDISPVLSTNISRLLPENNEKDYIQTFVAIGPILIDALESGKTIQEAAYAAHIDAGTAISLLGSKEFRKYVEAYIALGDLKDRDNRIRFSRAVIASMVANGIVSGKKEPLDYIEHIRRETEAKKGGSNVLVQINNTSVPRPYKLVEQEKPNE